MTLRKIFITFYLLACFIVLFLSCKKQSETDPQTAKQMAIHRNLGLAYLEESNFNAAINQFSLLIKLAPDETLGYANTGLCYLNINNLAEAERWLIKAQDLAPAHPSVSLMLARIYDLTDRSEQAVGILQDVLKKHPSDKKTLFKLAQYYLDRSEARELQHAEDYLSAIVSKSPANTVARLYLIEVLLKSGKNKAAQQNLEDLRQIMPDPGSEANEFLNNSIAHLHLHEDEKALTSVVILHNYLKSSAYYQSGLKELQDSPGLLSGEPLKRFVNVKPEPSGMQSGLPATLRFRQKDNHVINAPVLKDTNVSIASGAVTVMAHADVDNDGDEDLFVSFPDAVQDKSHHFLFVNDNGEFVQLTADFGIAHSGRDVLAVFGDYDNDGFLDLFISNTFRDRLYHNKGNGTFTDETKVSGIAIASAAKKIFFADLDLEGDLDLFIVTASRNFFFRNNLDGSFTDVTGESGLNVERSSGEDAGYADFDDDGDIDILVTGSADANRFFDNQRQGRFMERTAETGLQKQSASSRLATADYNNDGYSDLYITGPTGTNHMLFQNVGDGTFVPDTNSQDMLNSVKNLSVSDISFFDMDNDGHQDILTSSDQPGRGKGLMMFYNNGQGKFLDASHLLPDSPEAVYQTGIFDFDNDGDMDIFYIDMHHAVHILENEGGNSNNYHNIRLTGLRTASGKNNYFGIGARVEVKSGSLYQMRVMDTPVAHFGIGDADTADVIRVIWPNGVTQNVFHPDRNQTIVESQILKGSCPYLFAWNGRRFEFVTDVLWPSAIGMPLGIMAGEKIYAFANSTDEYLKIAGEHLKAEQGRYILQFSTELWETPYLDKVRLVAVDHLQNSDIFVNEQFTVAPFPPLHIYSVTHKIKPLSAFDGNGNDILEHIERRDGNYLSNMVPGEFQGIMEFHDVILDPGDLSQADSIFIFLNGWLFPTDASINVNVSQSERVTSVAPYMQVIDKQGNWKTVLDKMGFPKGKNKTMVFDLSDKFISDDFRVRIQTNMQIYWDQIFFATDVNSSPLKTYDLIPSRADLHYRGFSHISRETPYSPHIPDYYQVTSESKWRDLAGFYTRYGNVTELLIDSDNKYVIMNAGDEVTLVFEAGHIPGPPPGWRRDFLFYNDGWLKDGDLNTAHGQTVDPLPFHGMTHYPYGSEQAYPSDKTYLDYQKEYNTRQVTTEVFRRMLFEKRVWE